jgi:two-component system sensor histidine kinase CpxA
VSRNPTLYWVGARIPLRQADDREGFPGTVLMASPSFFGTPLFFDYKPWLAVAAAIIAVFALCWLPLIRGLSRSISQITRVTGQIAEGQFDRPLSENRRDELGQLAAAINRTAARLSGFVTGQKRFLGDIAHELCAPIARIQFALGILEQRAAEGQREYVDDLREEVRQMSSLVGELLQFSKAGMQQEERPLARVDVAELVQQVLSRESREGVKIEFIADDALHALADPEYLLRALSNLVRNAIRYAGDAGPIALTARRDGAEAVILVEDSGPGLPVDQLERVFTPFYRVEPSRNRALGGVGLGLAIVKRCVEGCKGKVQCRNRIPSGLAVEIRLKAVT